LTLVLVLTLILTFIG